MKVLFSIIAIAFSGSIALTQVSPYSPITVEHIWKDYLFFPEGVEGFRSMKDGEHFSKFSRVDGQKCIVQYSYLNREGEGEIILNTSTLSYNDEPLNISGYEFNQDESKILLITNREKIYRRSYSAIYFLYDRSTKKISPLSDEFSPQTLASYSPDGNKVSFIHQNNLFVKDLGKNEITAITTDGEMNKIINGTTDWVYEEEFAITKAYDWSPNGSHIAFLKFNESNVPDFNMTYHHSLYPDLYTFKYPKAGEANSKTELFIANLKNNEIEKVELGEYEYIPRLKWSINEEKLIVLTLNRHQNHLKYNWIEKKDNQFSARIVYEEEDDAYVEIDDNLIFLKDGKSFIRTSEKDGFNHIYKISINGEVTQITCGNWDVSACKGVDEDKGLIYYTSSELGPINQDIYVIGLNGKNKKRLSSKTGWNDAEFSTGMKYYVSSWSNANTPPTYKLFNAKGKLIETLEDNDELNSILKQFNFQEKKFTQIKGADQLLNAWTIYPPDFDSTKKYPVYYNIYCGPGSNMVLNSFGGANLAYHQLLAQKGYIVFCVDTRGTMHRGAKFKKSTYLQLGKLETEDLIATAQELTKFPYVDASRIGIMGWSYGGYMTSLAMTKGADIFKMGIAVAPVTNWRYYDNIYTERFMRTPQENESGYDENSPVNHVDKLKGKYFLIHGTGDDNVHVQNSMEMIKALVNANKQFDLFLYPNKDHGIYGGNTRNHLFNMMLNYTLSNL